LSPVQRGTAMMFQSYALFPHRSVLDNVAFSLKLREVTLPMLLPGIIGVVLFGFTLSYDELARTALTAGSKNTLPLEIWAMTTNVTSPALFAVGTVATVVSFIVIGVALISIAVIQRRRTRGTGGPI